MGVWFPVPFFLLGKLATMRVSSRSLVAHLEHLALRLRLFLSGRRLQPFPPLVNRWAPAPRFLSRNFGRPASLTCSPRAESRSRPPKQKRQGRRASRDCLVLRTFPRKISGFPIFGENLTHAQTVYTRLCFFPLPLIKKKQAWVRGYAGVCFLYIKSLVRNTIRWAQMLL